MKTRSKIIAAIATGLLMTTGGAAQMVVQEDLERCTGETTAERKLACFELLTLAGRQRQEQAVIDLPVEDATRLPPAERQWRYERVYPLSTVEPSTAPEVAVGEPVDREVIEPEVVTARVVEVIKGRFDILNFHFANGEIWRQREARRFQYPKEGEFEVTISTGMMGDFQLRVAGDGPMTRIERIK